MNRRLPGALIGALAVAAALATPATATASSSMPDVVTAPKVSASEMAAMQRDLHLTAAQANARLAQEANASKLEVTARSTLGAAYAGSWFDAASGTLVVASTDAAKAATLDDVKTITVAHSGAELNGVKVKIDALAGKAAPAGVTGWYVDSRSNSVVVTTDRNAETAAVKSFVAQASALGAGMVRTETVSESPRTKADIIGALPYYINNAARCSIGFTVYSGFVSAGHCGTPGSVATDSSGALLGTFQASTFPGNDYSYVAAASGVNLYGYMYGYDGYYYYVSGSTEMPEGSSICRSGSTTGMYCGTLQYKNQTVNYPQGTVYGLTQTNVCAEPGDSGGSWLSANQAQGVTSGGSGNCSSGGTTFFQPVNPILAAYGLTLVTTAP
jgi:streptogrisin C